jgi:hypothetical protein
MIFKLKGINDREELKIYLKKANFIELKPPSSTHKAKISTLYQKFVTFCINGLK